MSSRPFNALIYPIRTNRRLRTLSQKRNYINTQPVTDEAIAELVSKPIYRPTLADLAKHGRPPITPKSLFASANFTLSILPSRLAQRIQALRNLPFIVVTNPHISKIHNNYLHSLSTLLPWAQREIKTVGEEAEFAAVMADLVNTHAETIPILARGFLEARKYISPEKTTEFIDRHLRARIGTRLIAEQHLALHACSTLRGKGSVSDATNGAAPGFIGVIDTKLRPATIIRHCESTVGDICEFQYGVRPSVVLNGEPDYTFAQIPVHLEYILTELLKNAFRATIEQQMEREPIEITIAPLPDQPRGPESSSGESSDSASNIGPVSQYTPGVTIRIRDRGGGISPENYAQIWNYSFTTFNEDQIQAVLSGGAVGTDGTDMHPIDGLNMISNPGGSSLAGLGYGLPLGRAYAEYFGGGIAVQSLWGWGTDVYLSLKGVGNLDDV
jgi:signal transduction histidine kinase